MIREDRELLAALARLGREMIPLALRIMEGSAAITEQRDYARRLITIGERLRRRADETVGVVVEGEVLIDEPLATGLIVPILRAVKREVAVLAQASELAPKRR